LNKIILCFLFLSSINAKTIVLGTYKIPRYVKSHDKGEFITLVKKIAQETGLKIKIEVYPPKRTLKLFNQGDLDGYFPSLDILNSKKVSKSRPYYYKKDFLFYEKGKPIDSLGNKEICLTNGYPYGKNILTKKDVNFHFSGSDEACLEMVQRKRVHGFICEGLTGVAAINKLKLGVIEAKQEPLSTMPVYFAFQNNKEGQKLSQSFTKELTKLQNSGELSNLFKKAKNSVKYYLRSYDPTSY